MNGRAAGPRGFAVPPGRQAGTPARLTYPTGMTYNHAITLTRPQASGELQVS